MSTPDGWSKRRDMMQARNVEVAPNGYRWPWNPLITTAVVGNLVRTNERSNLAVVQLDVGPVVVGRVGWRRWLAHIINRIVACLLGP